MKSKSIILFLIMSFGVVFSNQALALLSLDVKAYKSLQEKEGFSKTHQSWLMGLSAGLGTYNAILKNRAGISFFCIPETSPSLEDYQKILDSEIELAEMSGALKDHYPVEVYLMIGLEKNYPCK